MNKPIKLLDCDIDIVDKVDGNYSLWFTSLEGCEILWSLSDVTQLKEQILENQKKAEKYDDLMNANSELIKSNVSLTETYQENKELKEQIKLLEKIAGATIDWLDLEADDSPNYSAEADLAGRLNMSMAAEDLKDQRRREQAEMEKKRKGKAE